MTKSEITKVVKLPQYTIQLTEDFTGIEKVITLEMTEESRFTDFIKALKDITFHYIGSAFIYEDFTPCTLSFRYYTDDTYVYHFDDIEDMSNWFFYFFQEEQV